MDAADVDGDLVEVLFTEEQIQQKLAALAMQIETDYAGKDVLLAYCVVLSW